MATGERQMQRFRPLRLSIQAKIILLLLILTLVSVSMVSIYLFRSQYNAFIEGLQERLMGAAEASARLIDGADHEELVKAYQALTKRSGRPAFGWNDLPEVQKLPHYQEIQRILHTIAISHHLDFIYTLIPAPDGQGVITIAEASLPPSLGKIQPIRPEMARALQNGEVVASGVYRERNGTWISASAPIIGGRRVVGLVEADYNLQNRFSLYTGNPEIREKLGALRRNIVLGTLLGLILTGYIGYYLARRLTAPALRLFDAAQKVASGDMSVRVPVATSWFDFDELVDLSRVFNQMVADLEKSQQSRLEALVQSMTDGAILADTAGKLVVINPAARQMLGLDMEARPSEIPLKALEALDLLHLWEEALAHPDRVVRREIRLSPDTCLIAPNTAPEAQKDPRIIVASCTAARESASGAVVGIVTTLLDMTRERELQKMKEDFLASVSHELRSPLTAIAGFTEVLLEEENLTPRHQEYVQIIDQNSRRLLRLINDLLDLTKLEAGMMRMSKTDIDLEAMVQKAIDLLSPLYTQKQLDVTVEIPGRLPRVMADPDRIEQVLINLISNAIKFTPEKGHISVGAAYQNGQVKVWISDTGVGIASRDLDRIFDKYQQLENKWTYGIKGTGLGLPIAKQIIEAHRGRIWAQSEEGKGSTFTFALPVMEG